MSARSTTIGMYHIEKTIGYGGIGTVYLGRHSLLGRAAAVKVLLPAVSKNRDIVERFFTEARALSRIIDPGIVQIFDFGYLGDGRAFIVMEFLEGESMSARLKRISRFDVLTCLRLSKQICGSLAAVHAKGISHRDLKPGNIFLVKDAATPGGEHIKIFDLGIARQTGDGTGMLPAGAGAVMATPMYRSPEQCRGAGTMDHRSDIYSMACVMFTMLTGQPPFGGRAARDLVGAHLGEPAPLASSRVPEVPGIVDEVLQRCLKKSPDERFQSMAELAQAIDMAEQALTSATAPGTSLAPGNGSTPHPVTPVRDDQLAASVSRARSPAHDWEPARRDDVAAPEIDRPSIAPISRGGSGRRRRLAGTVIVTASLLGVLCAVRLSARGDHDDVARGASAVQATARSTPALQRQPDPIAPPAPAPPTRAFASSVAGPPGTAAAGEVSASPPLAAPAAAAPSPAQPRADGQRMSGSDTRGNHANARRPAAPSSTIPKRYDSPNVTRGD